MLIAIDPGHGGYEIGAKVNDICEKDLNLEIADKLYDKLIAHQFSCYQIRAKDELLSLADRCNVANSINADLFISIHCNAFTDSRINGFEVHYYDKGKRLAETLTTVVDDKCYIKTREPKKSNFQVLRDTKMTAILIECGFMTNKFDLNKLIDDNFQHSLVEAIIFGLVLYYH